MGARAAMADDLRNWRRFIDKYYRFSGFFYTGITPHFGEGRGPIKRFFLTQRHKVTKESVLKEGQERKDTQNNCLIDDSADTVFEMILSEINE